MHNTREAPYVVEAMDIVKQQMMGQTVLPILRGIDLRLKSGGFMAVMGASGSGKSTLLHIIGCLDRPTSGRYYLDGIDVLLADDQQLSRLRASTIGFVFQTFNLIDHLTVAQNVSLPFLYQDTPPAEVKRRVERAIEAVGLGQRAGHRPGQLSGGEMQRTAIARALAVDPKLILADEPTGNLDSETSLEIMALLRELNTQGRTIVLVTHDHRIAAQAQTCMTISDGRMVDASR